MTSRVIRRTPNVWDVEPDGPDTSNETRFPDFGAFFLFAFPVLELPRIGLPANEVAPLVLCAIALGRPTTSRRRVPAWFLGGLMLLFAALTLTSYVHGLEPARRLLHVALYVVLALFIASGRIHVPSAVRGLTVGLIVSVVASIAGFGPDSYPGRLTGYLGDPNVAGYLITVLGAVAVGLGARRHTRTLLMLIIPVAVVLTYSRTTLLALTFAVVWVVVGRRVGTLVGLGLVGAMIYVVGHIPPELKAFGPFADRAGSDALRSRIIAQEHIDIATSPWIGSGAGTARVQIGTDLFFYHSSYLALQREGGILSIVILVGVVVLTFLSVTRMPRSVRNPWLEASVICLMVCAVNLGEVLLELPAAVALGMLMHHRLNAESAPGDRPEPVT